MPIEQQSCCHLSVLYSQRVSIKKKHVSCIKSARNKSSNWEQSFPMPLPYFQKSLISLNLKYGVHSWARLVKFRFVPVTYMAGKGRNFGA